MKYNNKKPTPQASMINENIRGAQLQLITHEGDNIGVVSRIDALKKAEEVGLDLVLLAEKGNQGYPVVKIMDFGKVLYEKKKKLSEAKKHQKIIQVKEIKLRPKIGQHDFKTKMNQGTQFVKEGKHLKITLMFRGREKATKEERGNKLFQNINDFFEQVELENLVQEKDARIGSFWSRMYYVKKKK